MRTLILSSLVLASIVAVVPAWGQAPNRGARFGAGRFGAKPGEIITRPDLSERWRDELQVGQAAPEFTLPLASGAGDAKAIAERQGRDARGTRKGSVPIFSEQKTGTGQGKGSVPIFSEPKMGTDPGDGDSPRMVSLKELRASRPVVLIFGSVTCPPFRGQLSGIDEVYQDFRERAEFLFVYIREAHPDSVLSLVDEQNRPSLVKIPQHTTAESRTEAAAACGRTLELSMPIAVDAIDNRVGRAYAGWPNRMVVVGTDGRILFASPGSPRGTDAARLRAWLQENLPAKQDGTTDVTRG